MMQKKKKRVITILFFFSWLEVRMVKIIMNGFKIALFFTCAVIGIASGLEIISVLLRMKDEYDRSKNENEKLKAIIKKLEYEKSVLQDAFL